MSNNYDISIGMVQKMDRRQARALGIMHGHWVFNDLELGL